MPPLFTLKTIKTCWDISFKFECRKGGSWVGKDINHFIYFDAVNGFLFSFL